MTRSLMCVLLILLLTAVAVSSSTAQVKWSVGGRFGLSVGSGGGGSSAGLQIGPVGEVIFDRNMGVGTELNINTQGGGIVAWEDYFRYYFTIPRSTIKPYADAGIGLWFSGGTWFGIQFGGGVNIPVAKNLYVPADLELGPVFATGTTFFYLAITSGIRYEF